MPLVKSIAKGGFNLDQLEVKANTSKPWTFIFPKELLLKENMDLSKWKAYPPKQLMARADTKHD